MKKIMLAIVILLSGCAALKTGSRSDICFDATRLQLLAESLCTLSGKSAAPKLTTQDLCDLARQAAARKDEFCAGA